MVGKDGIKKNHYAVIKNGGLLNISKEQEAERRRRSFSYFISKTYPNFVYSPCYYEIFEALQQFYFDVRLGKNPRLILNLQPRVGKTSLTAIRFAAFCLVNNPAWEIVCASYAQSLAIKHSRQTRDLIASNDYIRKAYPHIKISDTSSAVNEWSLEVDNKNMGSYKACGVRSSLTGSGSTILIIDDSCKDAEEADSVLHQEKVWEWYTTVALTRLAPQHGIINIQTRWNLQDLTGKILDAEPGLWKVLKFPALDENDEPLFPERFTKENLLRIKKNLAPRWWNALYQQEPIERTGNIVKENFIKRFDSSLDLSNATMWLQSWDLRFGKKQSGSFVVGQIWCKHNNSYYLVDQVRERLGYTDTRSAMLALSNRYPQAKIRLVEHKANGAAIEDDLQQLGITLVEPRGDKIQRLERVYGIFVSGQVFISNHLDSVVEELLQFPNSKNDDQCFIAGTKILTLDGNKNIEDVKVNDFVITPFGIKKVLYSGMTGWYDVINQCELTGTMNHPIFNPTTLGFENLIDCTKYFKFSFWNILCLYRKLFFSMERNINFSVEEGITFLRQLKTQKEKERHPYIEISTNTIQEKKYLKVLSYIIRIIILITTTLIIWSVFQEINTKQNFIEKKIGLRNKSKNVKKILIGLEFLLNLGILLKKGKNGIFSTVKMFFLIRKKKNTFANSAILLFKLLTLGLLSVLVIVIKNIGIKILKEFLKKVASLAKITSKKSLIKAKENSVQESVQLNLGKQKVYNLTVEGGIYFANGVLVHNCDSLSQSLTYYLEKESYKLEVFAI